MFLYFCVVKLWNNIPDWNLANEAWAPAADEDGRARQSLGHQKYKQYTEFSLLAV